MSEGVMYQIEMLPDEEIRAWMDAEIVRMGEWFDFFDVSWGRTDTHHILYLWSNAKRDYGRMNHPHGRGLRVGDVADPDGLSLPTIQHEGRKLYHRLKKDYPGIRRDLGVK